MPTATQDLLEQLGWSTGLSDYALAKELDISRGAVSRWRNGLGHMSPANINAVCKLAGIKDPGRWQMFIGGEREKGPDGEFYRQMTKDLRAAEAGLPISKDGWLYTLIHGLPTHIAGVVLACVAVFGLANPPPAQALTLEKAIATRADDLYIMRTYKVLGIRSAWTPCREPKTPASEHRRTGSPNTR